MKKLIVLTILLSTFSAEAQRDLTPNKRRDAFGTRDFRNLNNYGFQFQLGPTWTMTRLNNKEYDATVANDGFNGKYLHDPKGRLGVYGEIGMFHFPKKRSKLSLKLKTVLVSYFDWGLGFKYFRGTENVIQERLSVPDPEERSFSFGNGNVYGRFSIHKNIKISENWFLDNTLGVNLDYKLINSNDDYNWSPMTDMSAFYKPFHAQLHYGLAVGTRLKRGSYLMLGARTPILGYESYDRGSNSLESKDFSFGNPALRVFSSKYWPILFHLKYMFVLEKKTKGCPPAEIKEDDRERYRNGQ